MYAPWKERLSRWAEADRFRQHEDKVLLLLTLIIGAVVGLVVVAFILLTENLALRMYPAGGAPWRRLVVPLAGALATGFLLYRYFPNARGSGIPQTKTALFLHDGFISFRTVLGKFGLSSVSLASGIALGREGPSVHVGAGIASTLGRRLGLSGASVKALVPVGASAALAAAFNTPIAAVLFSLEEVMGNLHAPVLGSIVLSSATSWMVLHLLLGDEPLFHVPAYQLVHPVEFVLYAALGVVGGLVSVSFVKLLLWQRRHFLRVRRTAQWLMPAVGGLTVGVLGWFFPDVLGVGYSYVSQALNGQMAIGAMALLVGLKVVATATCYASGNAGGIFGPSLFIGAMMGGAIGGVAHMLLPDYTGSAGAYALVGMGAAFAGIIRVPLTSVIMIFEITRDYSIIVPLMIANLLSYFISSRLQEEPVYEALQHQDGIHLPSGTRAREALLMVGNGYRPDTRALAAEERIEEALEGLEVERGAWPVVDAGGLRGMVTLAQLEQAAKSGRGGDSVGLLVPVPGRPGELTAEIFPHVHIDHPLDAAMRRLAASGLNALPVVSRSNVRELKGTISLQDIVAAYRMGLAEQAPGDAPRLLKAPGLVLAGTVAVLIAMATVAGFLNYFYRSERTARAERYFREANELAAKERYDEAVERYRNALSISHRYEHRLALASVLVKAKRFNEAEVYLDELLRARPDEGPANLELARVYAGEGRIEEAVDRYHRALYGSWPRDSRQNRVEVRLELIGALGKAGLRDQVRSELLVMLDDLPGDPATRKRVAHLLLEYGLEKQGLDLFRELAKRDRQDADVFSGIGDAEFALGDYEPAREAYREAAHLNPADRAVARQLDACDEILSLDPTLPGLGAAERSRRARKILEGVVGVLDTCTASAAAAKPPASLETDLDTARKLLLNRKPASWLKDSTGNGLDLAVRLWGARGAVCGPDGRAGEPLGRVMARLSH